MHFFSLFESVFESESNGRRIVKNKRTRSIKSGNPTRQTRTFPTGTIGNSKFCRTNRMFHVSIRIRGQHKCARQQIEQFKIHVSNAVEFGKRQIRHVDHTCVGKLHERWKFNEGPSRRFRHRNITQVKRRQEQRQFVHPVTLHRENLHEKIR